MESSGASTAIMFAVAAVLWFAYLIPTWFRRREYLATERNATRLQQTLRILAETAEVPEQVRVEASARGAAQQAKLLRERDRQRTERERAQLVRVRAGEDPAIVRASLARRRVRRSRLVTALVLLTALAVGGTQLALVATTGAVTSSWIVLGAAALTASVSLGTLRRLARRRVPAPLVVGVAGPRVETARQTARPRAEEESSRPSTWTPVPVPKPLYLDKPAPQRLAPSLDAERLMREASAAAERALRAAHAEPEVLAFPDRGAGTAPAAVAAAPAAATPSAPSAPPPAPSRWASMGIVETVPATSPDLDEVLRRRRVAG